METKFHLLPIGQHFEWEGVHYVKTTPLIANKLPEGGQRFIPRAAMVQVTGGPAVQQPPQSPVTLDAASVRAAIEHYHRQALQLCNSRSGHAELEQAYRVLLGELKL